MKDFVSNRWIRVLTLATLMSVAWAIFIPNDFPWTGLVWATLALSAALWVSTRSNRPITQVIDDIETERVSAVATPVRVAMPVPKAIL